MLKALYIMNSDIFDLVYGKAEREEIESLVDIYAPVQNSYSIKKDPLVLRDVELIFTTWSAPPIDEEFLNAAPNLKAVFYGAGSIRDMVSEAFWNRGVVITSAYAANALPVAEFALSQILFCLKCGWHHMLAIKRDHKYPISIQTAGAYGSTVGILSLGMIGRRVCELLSNFDVNIIAFDPYASERDLPNSKAKLGSLDEVFETSDVVSVHTPWIKDTEGMISGRHFESMKPYASFINTARGAVVREEEMIEVLKNRQDIVAVLDVTWPEPPTDGSLLYTLPNVVLTPHIAGSLGAECRRMGRYMVEELKRYLNGKKLIWSIDREKSKILA